MIDFNQLFEILTGKLPALEKTDDGEVPLIYGTEYNNGVEKFVSVEDESQIFEPPLVTVSYLGTSFVQVIPFTTSVVDKSNIMVLKPLHTMSLEAMYFYAFQINRVAKFGFNYGRRMNMRQLKKLKFILYNKHFKKIHFKDYIPKTVAKKNQLLKSKIKFEEFLITELFILVKGDFHALDILDKGNYPTVSRTSFDNGIAGYYDIPDDAEIYHKGWLTVSTLSGDTFIQFNDFIATDNVIICKPQKSFLSSTLLFIQRTLNRQKWRYSYGRQCYNTTFKKTKIFLPVTKDGEIDEKVIQRFVENAEYWEFVNPNLPVLGKL